MDLLQSEAAFFIGMDLAKNSGRRLEPVQTKSRAWPQTLLSIVMVFKYFFCRELQE